MARIALILGVASVLGTLALTCSSGAWAAAGDLDTTFGVGGVTRTDIGPLDTPSDLLVQPDGKILTAGTVDANGTRNIVLLRYRSDGAPDFSFGSGGLVRPDRFHQVAPRLALQADGKIVVATRGEFAGGPILIYRFLADGTPDLSFGSAGIASLPAPIARVAGVAVLPDGKIVVAAWSGSALTFARFSADGAPDAGFGSGGSLTIGHDRLWVPLAFVVQGDGRMLVAGYAWELDRVFLDGFVARFRADGTFDASFGTGGIALVQRPSNASEFQALAVAPDGSIVAGGRTFGSIFNENQWLLAKLSDRGVLDPTFGSSGVAIRDMAPGDEVVLDLVVHGAGIRATGAIGDGSFGVPLVAFTPAGTLDPSFGVNGIATAPGRGRGGRELAVQSDGKVLALGSTFSFVPSFNEDLYLARFEDAPPDATPPALLLPLVLTRSATGPDGALVDYSTEVSARDDVDGVVPVVCDPPSGSTFGIGDTTVSCSATDAAANSARGSFTVHVKGASEQVDDLAVLVQSYNLQTLGSSLLSKLTAVSRLLADGNPRAAEEVLASFDSQVRAQRGKALAESQADTLLGATQQITDVIVI